MFKQDEVSFIAGTPLLSDIIHYLERNVLPVWNTNSVQNLISNIVCDEKPACHVYIQNVIPRQEQCYLNFYFNLKSG